MCIRDSVNTIKVGDVDSKLVPSIDTEKALLAPQRIGEIVGYVLEHFDQKTKRASGYLHSAVTNVAEAVSSCLLYTSRCV